MNAPGSLSAARRSLSAARGSLSAAPDAPSVAADASAATTAAVRSDGAVPMAEGPHGQTRPPGPAARPILFCIGHPDRGDDAAAEAAVARVAKERLACVELVRALDLEVEALMAAGPIIVVDAIRGLEPGTVAVWTLHEVAERPAGPTASTHGLPLPAVLRLAAALGGRPLNGRFVGIAGARFGIGQTLSAPVRAALPRAARAIEAAICEVAPCA